MVNPEHRTLKLSGQGIPPPVIMKKHKIIHPRTPGEGTTNVIALEPYHELPIQKFAIFSYIFLLRTLKLSLYVEHPVRISSPR